MVFPAVGSHTQLSGFHARELLACDHREEPSDFGPAVSDKHGEAIVMSASCSVDLHDTFADEAFRDTRTRPGRLKPLRTLAEARLASATASELVSVYVTRVDPSSVSVVIKCVSQVSNRYSQQVVVTARSALLMLGPQKGLSTMLCRQGILRNSNISAVSRSRTPCPSTYSTG